MKPSSRTPFHPTWKDHLRKVEERHRAKVRAELDREQKERKEEQTYIFLAEGFYDQEKTCESNQKHILGFKKIRYDSGFWMDPFTEVMIPVDGLYDFSAEFKFHQSDGASFIAPKFELIINNQTAKSVERNWLLGMGNVEKKHFVDQIELRHVEFCRGGETFRIEWSNECAHGQSTICLDHIALRVQKIQ